MHKVCVINDSYRSCYHGDLPVGNAAEKPAGGALRRSEVKDIPHTLSCSGYLSVLLHTHT